MIGAVKNIEIRSSDISASGTDNWIDSAFGITGNTLTLRDTSITVNQNSALTIDGETVTIEGGSFRNFGALTVKGNVTVDSVAGLLAGEGATLALSGDATVNSGDIDLTVSGISNTATDPTTLTALASEVTIGDSYTELFDNITAASVVLENGTSGSFTIVSGSCRHRH